GAPYYRIVELERLSFEIEWIRFCACIKRRRKTASCSRRRTPAKWLATSEHASNRHPCRGPPALFAGAAFRRICSDRSRDHAFGPDASAVHFALVAQRLASWHFLRR